MNNRLYINISFCNVLVKSCNYGLIMLSLGGTRFVPSPFISLQSFYFDMVMFFLSVVIFVVLLFCLCVFFFYSFLDFSNRVGGK